ncbi:hypothetical protein MBLNU230_g5751t1 [Neophaeotheca triangularis]
MVQNAYETRRFSPPLYGTSQSGPTDSGQYSPQAIAGHKRKAEALRGPTQSDLSRARPPAPPSVPAFGGPIVTPSQIGPQKQPPQATKQAAAPSKPRKKGSLFGIGQSEYTPAQVSSSEDEADDEDEEAAYAELGNKLTFEHNGTVLSLNTAADIAAWKKERSQNWPTRARMTEREARRREVGLERRRMLAEAQEALRPRRGADEAVGGQQRGKRGVVRDANARNQPSIDESLADGSGKWGTELERTRKRFEEQSNHLASLRAKVVASEAKNKALRAQAKEDHDGTADDERAVPVPDAKEESQAVAGNGDSARKTVMDVDAIVSTSAGDGEGMADVDANTVTEAGSREHPSATADRELDVEAPPQPQPQISSHRSASLSSSSGSSNTDSDSDSDGPPEQSTSKNPAPKPSSQESKVPLCRYYVASGFCRDGVQCRYRHELPERGSGAALAMEAERKRKEKVNQEQKPFIVPVPGAKRSITDRLVERQKEEEDVVALGVVKYLGEMGFFASK